MTSSPNDIDDIDDIDDYVSGHLDDREAAKFEERLFGDEFHEAAAAYDAIAHQLREAGRRGLLQIAVAPEDAQRYIEDKAHVAVVEITEPVTARVEIDGSMDYVLTRFALDLDGVQQLDLEVHFDEAGLVKTMPDLTFDAVGGSVFMFCDIKVATEAAGHTAKMFTRFVAVDGETRRTLADFRFGGVFPVSGGTATP